MKKSIIAGSENAHSKQATNSEAGLILSKGKGLDLMGWFNPVKRERVGSHGLV
jgi:hypothetical protein